MWPSRSTRAMASTRFSSSTSASDRHSRMRRAKQIATWGLLGLAGLLAVVAITVTVGFAWLRSDSGRDWLARQIEDATSTPGEMQLRSEEHTSELQSLMRISYAVFCLKKKKHQYLYHYA